MGDKNGSLPSSIIIPSETECNQDVNHTIPLTDFNLSQPVPEITEKTTLEAVGIIAVLTGVTFISVSGSGILTTALPRIALDINLDQDLIFWPASVYSLAAGCTLLPFGALSNIVGSKLLWLIGSGFSSLFILCCGLARTGIQFIIFRAILGIFVAMCLPTSMSLVTASFPPGSKRNVAFAVTGADIKVRYTFSRSILHRIDLVGVIILSTALALLSYVLAMITLNYQRISDAQNIALLVISVLLFPVFSAWEGQQERFQKATLIPNSLWTNTPFLLICVSMFFTWAAFNAFQYQSSLYFQDVQDLSALQASIRFLPMAVVGVLINSVTAYLVTKINVNILLGISALITAVSPILMALSDPKWSYWNSTFVAIVLSPISGDVLWTVSSLIISRSFPSDSQGLAGGVFSTISQLGNSVGLAITAVIAASVTAHKQQDNPSLSAETLLLQGYRAAYWTILAGMILVCLASSGLRRVGKVGIKYD
ncbi:hypothetical protein N7495_000537 [Penicillium taxi]|uniref:uncharacterized protein n=1 Tax=Penicillium taxi TaxID=168475 RepID=UPI00254556F0|nr:uncharacterized protein N7495_000537 [Penicillium taxi]KAJ5907855.1 hypothetical protein N7495_000537 [Penicillium taxi]